MKVLVPLKQGMSWSAELLLVSQDRLSVEQLHDLLYILDSASWYDTVKEAMEHNFAVIVLVCMMLNMARLVTTALPLWWYNTVRRNDTFIDGDALDEYYKFKT